VSRIADPRIWEDDGGLTRPVGGTAGRPEEQKSDRSEEYQACRCCRSSIPHGVSGGLDRTRNLSHTVIITKTRRGCNQFLVDFAPMLGYILQKMRAVSSVWESATMALWRSPVRPRYGPQEGSSGISTKDNRERLSFFLFGEGDDCHTNRSSGWRRPFRDLGRCP
jgi:hypothetical protein